MADSPLNALSPLDGRYLGVVEPLRAYFSEFAFFKYRVMVEAEYLIALGDEPQVTAIPPIIPKEKKFLRGIYENFSLEDCEHIKEIETRTRHDVKSIEYFLQGKLKEQGLSGLIPMVHFGLTSQDVNNTAQPLMLKDALQLVLIPKLEQLWQTLRSLAKAHKNIPMLSRTHGQSASPTTVGKEMAVYAERLRVQLEQLKTQKLYGKFSGATGNFHTHTVAYPDVNWIKFVKQFVKHLGLELNLVTTQIDWYDGLAALFDNLRRINVILMDIDQDMWRYISDDYFVLKLKPGEVGSSTMPHKVNPIDFENSEGNLGMANAILTFMSQKLPVSRLQRDLTDSTVLRNVGVALGHSLLAYYSALNGFEKVRVNEAKLNEDLAEHWEVLAEAIQTVLRKVGYKDPYETVKELTRGKDITADTLRKFIGDLKIDEDEKKKLLSLSPETYTGLAAKLVDRMK